MATTVKGMSNTNSRVKTLNVGVLNVQGCKDLTKQDSIYEDALNYNLQILGLTETHVKEEDTRTINVKNGSKSRTYKVYYGGIQNDNPYSGTGIIIEESLNPKFKRISDRITTANCQINKNRQVNIIIAYAPTLIKSEKDPQIREDFYNELDKISSQHKKDKHLLLVLGDLNAKTGSGHANYPENIGKFGKGYLNSNGEHLLEYAKENDLILTNTLFPHKLAHRTTWTSIERTNPHNAADGEIRRNPYRNQIDYIITKIIHKKLITNSRSYSGTATATDHKLVKAELKLEWWRMKKQIKKSTKMNIDKLRDQETKTIYQTELNKRLILNNIQEENPNESWNRIATTCKETAKTVLGVKKHNTKLSMSNEIKEVSLKQKKLKDDAESTIDKTKRTELKKQRNKTLKAIKKLLKDEQNEILDQELKEIERYKNDSNKCYQAIRKVNSHKPRKQLAIYDEKHRLVTSEDEQINIITKYFQKLFSSEEIPNVAAPERMAPPFNSDEMKDAAGKLKNNKATGRDEVHAELIKYGTEELYSQIAELLNKTSETGDYPEEIRRGILTPLAKPPKKDEKVNVRPIILLSVLRKIITITLIDRCWNRMKTQIPLSQAAYQSGRSTTEQVFTIKILAEKAIISENYDIFLLMLDMSKAFDTVNRKKLMEILANILTKSELHMMYLLINDVIINVRIGNKIGRDIPTAIGICQGDCLSALLFIIYLANALKPLPPHTEREDHKKTLWSALDWIIDKDTHKIEIDPQYADDISFIRSDESKINQAERIIPQMLKDEGLYVNSSKTERHHFSRNSDGKWKKCKYLGSLLGTEEDIKRRKGLAQDSYKSFETIFNSKHVSEAIRIRIFRAYIESIFLYNSEIWTLTKSLENTIDSFQRRLLRKVIHVRWPRVISNKRLYERTNVQPWSLTIFKRRLSWFGHLLRLPPETPARNALKKYITPVKKPIGRPKTTWLNIIISDIKENSDFPLIEDTETNLNTLEVICSDRKGWNKAIGSMMLTKLTNVQ